MFVIQVFRVCNEGSSYVLLRISVLVIKNTCVCHPGRSCLLLWIFVFVIRNIRVCHLGATWNHPGIIKDHFVNWDYQVSF